MFVMSVIMLKRRTLIAFKVRHPRLHDLIRAIVYLQPTSYAPLFPIASTVRETVLDAWRKHRCYLGSAFGKNSPVRELLFPSYAHRAQQETR
jgi:hypothetical protein